MKHTLAFAVAASLFALGCGSNDAYVEKLRTAVEQSKVSLGETVVIAEAGTENGAGVKARLDVFAAPVFTVKTVDADLLHAFEIDLGGELLSSNAAGSGSGLCSGAVSLADGIAIAEREGGGIAVAVEPDDDEECALEVQVLTPDTLWEVKVGRNGDVLESEESDEDGGADED